MQHVHSCRVDQGDYSLRGSDKSKWTTGSTELMATQKAEALFDFEPTAEVELKMQKGEVVTVKRMSVGEGWWEGELNGKRGLFPSSFVKLLPVVHEVVDTGPSPPTPLTPHSTKKAFMETLLAPQPSTLDEIYDEERAQEVFVSGHNEVAIEAGPKWKGRPPMLTVVVKEPQTEPRFSGMKHVTLYDVDTKELGSCVSRKYKQFLWLYDRLAENFPCISLPPLPVKQGSGQERKDVRRKGLEKFLRKVARHPMLGCTRFLKVFLTDEDAKSDKEWKIGKHLSHLSHNIKLPKTSRKLFHAPVYCTVKYPPYNVPISQLPSIEKFSRFSRLLDSNINTLHMACRGLSLSQRDMMSNVNLLANDLKCFARGMESTGGAQRRKLQAKVSASGPSSGPLPATSVQPPLFSPVNSSSDLLGGSEGQEESSGGEDGEGGPQWNWRDDEKFNAMVGELLDLASGIKKTSHVFQEHQEAMEEEVMETLQEYSGVINTLPGLVRLHEEAMDYYNCSKNKDSKKEAEEVRQNCETLNNILLAEFDYFSNHVVHDFQAMILRFLIQQGNFHRRLAEEWDTLHNRYAEHISHHQSDVPIQVSPTRPTTRATSASHPQLHTLHPPPPPPPSLSHRSPSDILSSSGGGYATSHSQDDVGSSSFVPPVSFSQSQSHPNIHSLIHTATSKPDSGSNSVETDPGPALTSSSDSHTTSTTPPAQESQTSPRNYVNFDVDELRVGSDHDRRLRSLSPLELSIERELERNCHRSNEGSSEGRDLVPGENAYENDLQQLHPYANWQFEKMNEKSQKTSSNAHTKLLNGGPQTARQETAATRKPLPGSVSIPRKPLKPPSPFKLSNLSDLTALDKPSVAPSSRARERSPIRNFGESGKGGGGGADSAPGAAGGGRPLGKALSTSKLHDISPTTERRNRGLADTTSHSTRHIDQLLPSQLNLGGKARSYTTSHFLPKKKPILPPVGGKHKSHAKIPEIAGTIPEQRETLESSGEIERSFEKSSSKTSHSSAAAQLTYSKSMYSSLGRDVAAGAATKHPRQGSPSNELMRKLSLRRQKLEQQIVPSSSTTGGDSSSRCTSTSSTQSELVCSYNTKRSQEDSSLDESSLVDVELRAKEEANLAKYGIMEDVEGGSFVI